VLPRDNVTLKFLLQATGDVSNSDVDLAVASEAIILGFNVKAPGSVKSYAERKGVEIRLYRVIYELIDDVRNAMEGLLEPVEVNSNASLVSFYQTSLADTIYTQCISCITLCMIGNTCMAKKIPSVAFFLFFLRVGGWVLNKRQIGFGFLNVFFFC